MHAMPTVSNSLETACLQQLSALQLAEYMCIEHELVNPDRLQSDMQALHRQ